jgi:hypothetical protein
MSFYLLTLSIIPLFVSRAFFPIFATGLFARWGRDWDVGWLGFFEDFTGIGLLDTIPAWAIDDEVMIVLGILAGVEFMLQRFPETRVLLQGMSDTLIKAVGAGCTSYLLVGGDLAGIAEIWIDNGELTDFDWGRGLQYTWSFGVGFVVFFLASIRAWIYASLEETDPDDDLGLQGLMAWLEDTFSFVGIFVAIIMPAVTAVTALAAIVLGWNVKASAKVLDSRRRTACDECGDDVTECAPHCAHCGASRAEPSAVGWMGLIQSDPATDSEEHCNKLREGHRCHHCGERLPGRGALQICEQCQTPAFATRADLTRYLDRVQGRLGRTLLICGLWSLLPVVGLIPGLLYYRLSLAYGLTTYTSRSKNFAVRIQHRLLMILLLGQWVPGLGTFSLPLVCFFNYRLSRKALLSQELPAS